MARFSKPSPVTALDLAFPANVMHLMPEWADIPQECKQWSYPFAKIASMWFFEGLPKGFSMKPRDRIDPTQAMRHLRCILGSFEPKHEHKIAAVAYLMSLWFEAPTEAKV